MGKQPPAVEWHIAENEADWARLHTMQADHAASFAAQQQSFYKNACWAMALILGLLLTLDGWWWYTAQSESQLVVADYNDLTAELIRDLARPVVPKDSSVLTGIPTGASTTPLEPAIVIVEAQGEQAVVSIVTAIKAGRLICREQRLYHHTGGGWQQTVVDEKVITALRQQQTTSTPLGAVCN